jgi:hypothetical protein
MKRKRDRLLTLIIIGICGAVIIGDLGMHLLFGPKDTPSKTAVKIIEKLENKNKIFTNDVGRLIIQNDSSSSDIMRPGGWSGQFANYSHP